ncbi:MAG: hypothetical protein ACMXYM_04740 [Candidatus Woesearchaeota archaeon]
MNRYSEPYEPVFTIPAEYTAAYTPDAMTNSVSRPSTRCLIITL